MFCPQDIAWTNYHQTLSKHLAMAEKKNFFPEFRIYAPSDLAKKWFVFFYDAGGRRIRKYGNINQYDTGPERMKEAHALIDALRVTYEHVEVETTLKERLYKIIEEKKPGWRKKTYQSVKSKLDRFYVWMNGREVNEKEVISFFRHLSSTRHKTTYNSYLQKLRYLFGFVDASHLFAEIKGVKEHRTPARYFQKGQMEQLKAEISLHDPPLWLFIEFMYYCFIRPGELRHLRAGDILFEQRRIIVRGEISKNHKTEYVAIPEAFLRSLKRLSTLPPDTYIFPGKPDRKKPIGINTMSTRHRNILRRLDFGDAYKLYSWKHTGAVMAVKAGIGLKELQLQLRHHSLDQVNEYLRQMGVSDMQNLQDLFPEL